MAATTTEGTGPGAANKRVAYLSSQLPKLKVTTTTTNDQDLITGDSDGGIPGDCPKYVVSSSNLDCPYQTIQDGYDAAVADGRDESDPAVVRVLAGYYSEDVLMTVPGIHIVADTGHSPQETPFGTSGGAVYPQNTVQNIGKLTVNFSSAVVVGPTHVQNIDWIVDGLCLEVLGDLYAMVVFRECQFGPGLFMGSNDLTCVELSNTDDATLIIFQNCNIANFGAETVPLINTRNWTEFFFCNLQTGFIFDGVVIRAYGTSEAQSITLQRGVSSGALLAEQQSRFLTNNDQFCGGNILPTTGGDLEGVFRNEVTTVSFATETIFEDTTFGVGSVLRHLFTGGGSAKVFYGSRLEVFDVSGANVAKSVWKNPGATGGFPIVAYTFPFQWIMERTGYDPATPGDWAATPPTTLLAAVDRIAAAVAAAHGAIP